MSQPKSPFRPLARPPPTSRPPTRSSHAVRPRPLPTCLLVAHRSPPAAKRPLGGLVFKTIIVHPAAAFRVYSIWYTIAENDKHNPVAASRVPKEEEEE